ncbi:hypothetical protein L1049_025454 [Liquidambar formosana]|uniref:Pentatricopeptide repeat-containing protein n=1 Tax=Liquidambar formosana TaxID=63359 RepID=A0AAP0R8G2_LIQFO
MDLNWIVAALRHCGRIQAFKRGKSLHSHLVRHGFCRNVFLANNLIAMYVDFAFLNDARRLFDETPDRNVVTWTTMVSAYTNTGRPDEAIELFTQMLESQSEIPNGFMYSAVLKACGLVGNLELGKLIHRRISRAKLEFDTVLMNTLLDMYVKCGSLIDARKVFNEINVTNLTSWNTMISGYSKEGLMEEAVDLFHRMPELPDVVSWNSIIRWFRE